MFKILTDNASYSAEMSLAVFYSSSNNPPASKPRSTPRLLGEGISWETD